MKTNCKMCSKELDHGVYTHGRPKEYCEVCKIISYRNTQKRFYIKNKKSTSSTTVMEVD